MRDSTRAHLLRCVAAFVLLGFATYARGGIIVTPFRVAELPSGWDQIDFRVTGFTDVDLGKQPGRHGIMAIECRILALDGAVLSFPGSGATARYNTLNYFNLPVDPLDSAPKSFANFENVLGQSFARTPDSAIANDVFGTWFTSGDTSQPPVPTYLRPTNLVDDDFDETLFARVFVSHGGGVQISGDYGSAPSGRVYPFSTSLASVPESSAATLMSIGAAGLLFFGWLRRKSIRPQNSAQCIT